MCDRQGGNEKASPEITVTPEMVEAGAERLMELYGEVSTAYVVAEVFEAMARVERQSLEAMASEPSATKQ